MKGCISRTAESTDTCRTSDYRHDHQCVFFFCRVLHTMFSHLRAHAFARSVTVARSSSVQASSVRNKRQQQNRRPAAPRTPSRDSPNNNNNAGTSDHEWCVNERRNRHRHSIGKCANCSETNHVTANCKHHQEVQCRQCG